VILEDDAQFKLKARQDVLRLTVIAFITLGIASSSVVSSVGTAAATSSSHANLWAVPVNSCIDDGKLQMLRLKFFQENANPLEVIRIIFDQGESNEKTIEFTPGGLTSGDIDFDVDGSISIKTDGYYYLLKFLKGKFKVSFVKTQLDVGEHTALVQIETTDGVILEDDAQFKLKACEPKKPDLVAEFLWTPNWIKRDREYNAFFLETNEGQANAGEHNVGLYLSQNKKLESGDDLVGDKTVDMLKKGHFKIVHIKFQLDPDAEKGKAWLIAHTDDNEEIDEKKENNNSETHKIRVGRAESEIPLSVHEAEDDEEEEDEEEEDHDEHEESHKGKDKKGKKDD
jgi:hypothetical protein